MALALSGCLPSSGPAGVAPRPVDPVSMGPAPASPPAPADAYGKLPLYFVENRGQVDARVRFYAHARGATSYFTSEGVTVARRA